MSRKIAIVGLFALLAMWGAFQFETGAGRSWAQVASPTSTVVTETPTPTAEPTPEPTPIVLLPPVVLPTTFPHPCDMGDIAAGHLPPASGYGTFAYCGGSHAELLEAIGCDVVAIWHNTTTGSFVVWVPDSEVPVVNEDFFLLFPPDEVIPEGTIFIVRCGEAS